MNTDLLKKITILYIEDDEIIRTSIEETMLMVFKKVIVGKDGEEGCSLFEKNKAIIDIIISDINMPKLSGLEVLKLVRKTSDVPFIFVTAFTEVPYMLDAISYNVSEYIAKPFDVTDLFKKVAKHCEYKLFSLRVMKQKEEISRYLDALNKVAIVSKTDLKGCITYVNDIFCDIAQYDKDELLGKPHSIIRHPDMPSESFKKLWADIKDGKTWSGKVKNRAKDGSAYYVNATIMPIFDEYGKDIIEYIAIRFLTTDDELEKREFKKKVVANIQENKKQNVKNSSHIISLINKLKKYENTPLFEDALNIERKRSSKLLSQVKHFEEEIEKTRSNNEKLVYYTNEKVSKITTIASDFKVLCKRLEDTLVNVKNELEAKSKAYKVALKKIDEHTKKIDDLKDVIKYREDQLDGKI